MPGSSRIGCRGVEVYCGWRYSLLRISLLRILVDVPSRIEALSLWAYRCVSVVILSCATLIYLCVIFSGVIKSHTFMCHTLMCDHFISDHFMSDHFMCLESNTLMCLRSHTAYCICIVVSSIFRRGLVLMSHLVIVRVTV